MLEHGGALGVATRRYGIAPQAWLDLSTGVNPLSWQGVAPPSDLWDRLPDDEDDLVAAARDYYETDALLPVAGSQSALQGLPRLRPPCQVALPSPTYAEHARAWSAAGHQVRQMGFEDLASSVDQVDVVVVVNPNNPTAQVWCCETLRDWHARLTRRGGWLVVDEAFMDATPESGLIGRCPLPGLIVLRSLGKFFGLAGARVGMLAAEASLRQAMREQLGPWPIATPARWLAIQALRDRDWQVLTRERLAAASGRLATLLRRHGLAPAAGCALFQWVPTRHAPQLHDQLARNAVLTRLFAEASALRFGLPGGEAQWRHLESALHRATGSGV